MVLAVFALISSIAALGLTQVTRGYALRFKLLDVPNARSSHAVPVPRSGGIAIVVVSSVLLCLATTLGLMRWGLLSAIGGGGLAIAIVGFLDDRWTVRPLARLIVHLGAAGWAAYWLGGLPAVQLGEAILTPGWFGYVLIVIAVAGAANFFNFMDGIDGIAASEATFICWSGALVSCLLGVSSGSAIAAVIVGGASLGFLWCNWPPAKIFMGDVGSGYLGFTVAVLAVSCMREQPTAWIVWLMLAGVFLVDAVVTLARRLQRGEAAYEAHRSHAYQWLARRWNSHKRVTLAVIAVNILWLLPCGMLAALRPAMSDWLLPVALAPVVIAALLAGAGRPESMQRGSSSHGPSHND